MNLFKEPRNTKAHKKYKALRSKLSRSKNLIINPSASIRLRQPFPKPYFLLRFKTKQQINLGTRQDHLPFFFQILFSLKFDKPSSSFKNSGKYKL